MGVFRKADDSVWNLSVLPREMSPLQILFLGQQVSVVQEGKIMETDWQGGVIFYSSLVRQGQRSIVRLDTTPWKGSLFFSEDYFHKTVTYTSWNRTRNTQNIVEMMAESKCPPHIPHTHPPHTHPTPYSLNPLRFNWPHPTVWFMWVTVSVFGSG